MKSGWYYMAQIKHYWLSIQESYYAGMNYDEGRWWYKYYCALYTIFLFGYILRLFCKVFGHRLEASSAGLEDSGGEDIWCNRCGWSTRVWHN